MLMMPWDSETETGECETETETENNQVLRHRDQNQRDRDLEQCSQMHKRTRCWWNIQSYKQEVELTPVNKLV